MSEAGADDCSASLLFWFGSDIHRLHPAVWSLGHSLLNTGEEIAGKGDGCWTENKTKFSETQ